MHCALQHWTCMLCSNFVLCSTENDNNKSCKRQKARLSRTAESSFFFPRRDVGNLGPTDQQAGLNQLDQQAGHQPDQPARKKKQRTSKLVSSIFSETAVKQSWHSLMHILQLVDFLQLDLVFFPNVLCFFCLGFFAFFQLCLFSTLLCVLLQHVCFFSTRASSARALLQRDASSAWGGMPTKLDMPMQCDLVKVQTINIWILVY